MPAVSTQDRHTTHSPEFERACRRLGIPHATTSHGTEWLLDEVEPKRNDQLLVVAHFLLLGSHNGRPTLETQHSNRTVAQALERRLDRHRLPASLVVEHVEACVALYLTSSGLTDAGRIAELYWDTEVPVGDDDLLHAYARSAYRALVLQDFDEVGRLKESIRLMTGLFRDSTAHVRCLNMFVVTFETITEIAMRTYRLSEETVTARLELLRRTALDTGDAVVFDVCENISRFVLLFCQNSRYRFATE